MADDDKLIVDVVLDTSGVAPQLTNLVKEFGISNREIKKGFESSFNPQDLAARLKGASPLQLLKEIRQVASDLLSSVRHRMRRPVLLPLVLTFLLKPLERALKI